MPVWILIFHVTTVFPHGVGTITADRYGAVFRTSAKCEELREKQERKAQYNAYASISFECRRDVLWEDYVKGAE